VPAVTASTVNRKLAAVSAFYAHQARNGAAVGDLLAVWRTGGRGGWKPFLHHVSKGEPYRGRAIALKAPKKLPRILTVAEMQAILDACTRLRDRFFFALLHESGSVPAKRWACVTRTSPPPSRDQHRAAGQRERGPGQVRRPDGPGRPGADPALCRLPARRVRNIDSDYVFVNLFAEPRGQAWSYPAVYDLVTAAAGQDRDRFDPHWFRHSAATRWLRDGVPIEVVSKLLGHSSVTTTSADLRASDGGGRAGGAGEGRLAH
jgi:integrase/recombinase XerD